MVLMVGLAGSVFAAPRLRLSSAAVGPISVATGSDGTAQMVEAFNIGDGDLALELTANVPWLAVWTGEPTGCSLRGGICTPVNVGLATASLAKGRYTGLVTVSDPNAIDAPQTITVTVNIGGAVPDSLEFHVAPGGLQEQVIQANNLLGINASTDDGGDWLSLPSEGGGSFRFTFNYRVVARHLAEMAEGVYTGGLNVFNSVVGEENKWVPVTMTVTSGPILDIPAELFPRVAAGGPAMTNWLGLGNRGAGDLQATAATASTSDGGGWLTVELVSDGRAIAYTIHPDGLTPGVYTGLIEITSNASKSVAQLPVTLDVMAPGLAAVDVSTVVDITTQETGVALAPGSLARLRGTQLSRQDRMVNDGVPLPDILGGVRVLVNGVPAALFSVDQAEILLQVPYEIEPGEALLQVERDGEVGNQVELTILQRSPRIELAGQGSYAQVLFDDGTVAMPEWAGGRAALAGDTLNIAVTGLGKTDPETPTGQAPDPANPIGETVRVAFGTNLFNEGVTVDAFAAELVPGLPGHYVVRVTMPEGVTPGDAVSLIVYAGGTASNKLQIAVQ